MSMSMSMTMISCLVFAILFLFSHPAVAQPTNFQLQTLSATWSRRAGAASFVIPPESKIASAGIYLIGGRREGTNGLTNDVQRSSDSGRTWSYVSSYSFIGDSVPALYVGSFGSSNELLAVFGDSRDQLTSNVRVATTSLNSISVVAAPYAPRVAHGAAVLDYKGARYVVVTAGSGANGAFFNDVWITSAQNLHTTGGSTGWTSLPNAPWSQRSGIAITGFHSNSRIIVAGGQTVSNYFNDVWVLAFNSGFQPQWTQFSSSAFPTRAYGVMFNINEYLYFTSGRDQYSVYNDLYKSVDDGRTWTTVTNNANFPTRVSPSVFVLNNEVMVAAGGNSPSVPYNNAYNDVWVASLG